MKCLWDFLSKNDSFSTQHGKEYFVARFESSILYKHIWLYEYEQVKQDVIEAKNGQFSLYRKYAKQLAEVAALEVPNLQSYTCTYIPTIKEHLKQRGYDHAQKLSNYFSKNVRLKNIKTIKPDHQISQHSLNASSRYNNAKYKVIRDIYHEKIILIDDISTTRSTLFNASKMLKNAGCQEVLAMTICYREKNLY
ncbi:MAG: hypothetical protein U0R17_02025 [Acidimicrobiia bacterium]